MTNQDTKTITLYELIMHQDQIIYRNALSILKRLREIEPHNPARCATNKQYGNCPPWPHR